jgi:hypothetical protein
MCRGCRHRFAAGTLIDCPRSFVCMEVITVDMVFDVFKEIIVQIMNPPK